METLTIAAAREWWEPAGVYCNTASYGLPPGPAALREDVGEDQLVRGAPHRDRRTMGRSRGTIEGRGHGARLGHRDGAGRRPRTVARPAGERRAAVRRGGEGDRGA